MKTPRAELWRRSALPAAAAVALLVALSVGLAVGFHEVLRAVSGFLGSA